MQLVTGATGNVGAELVRALLDAGEPVRALVRSESGREALPEGVDGFVGNLDRSETLAAALDGAHGLHLLSGYADMDGLLAEVRSAGVRHVVLQSGPAGQLGSNGRHDQRRRSIPHRLRARGQGLRGWMDHPASQLVHVQRAALGAAAPGW